MSDRAILVTGASGTVGQCVVGHFLGKGDLVIGIVRREESVSALASRHPHKDTLVVLQTDLAAPGAVRALVREMAVRGLRPGALVNGARSLDYLRSDNQGLASRDDFLNEYLLDVVVPYELTMALALAPDSRLDAVVNIGSQYGIVAVNPNLYPAGRAQSPIHYGVAKAAVVQLTRELAVRLAKRRIRVNCISFGGIEGRVDEQFKEGYARLCPQGRMLRDADIAGPVDFLVSEASSGTTGHNLVVDGGWTAW
jgi:hypothetical protein